MHKNVTPKKMTNSHERCSQRNGMRISYWSKGADCYLVYHPKQQCSGVGVIDHQAYRRPETFWDGARQYHAAMQPEFFV